jgi:hypothetical protein
MGWHIKVVVINKTLITTYKAFAQKQRYSKDKPSSIAMRFKYGKQYYEQY